uniref:Uncharacterized protein n=1 Tax=Oryza glumipatula TaxID=40148 RepID=A0A0D9ZAJ8_9ORYZ
MTVKWLCRTYAMTTICFCPLRRILKMRLFHWMSTFVCGLQWRLRHLLPMMVISLSQVIFLCGITGSQLMPAGRSQELC